MKNFLKYQLNFVIITAGNNQNFSYSVSPYCNGITVKNIDGTNTDTVTVNKNVTLQPGDNVNKIPGESFSFGGNYGEIYQGRIEVAFSGAAGRCLIIEKFYSNYEDVKEKEHD